jgi:hypothetical protein
MGLCNGPDNAQFASPVGSQWRCSADGQHILADFAVLWDLASGEVIRRIQRFDAILSPDGRSFSVNPPPQSAVLQWRIDELDRS